MTFDELMTKILTILPDAQLGEDVAGEITICTGLREGINGDVVSY